MKNIKYIITALCGTALTSHSALLFNDLETDDSGNFVNAGTGWSGTTWAAGGSVVGSAGYATTSGATMINDFTGSGDLSLGAVTGWGTTIRTPTTATMSVSLGGSGSGDISVSLGGPGTPKVSPMNFNVTDLKDGVTSVTVEFDFSEPLAAIFSGAIPRNNSPFLVGFRTQGDGNPWNVDAEYIGLRHTTSLGGDFVNGLPAGADSVDMNGNSFNWGSGSSFSGESTTSGWQGVHLFDIDGDSTYENGINNDGILQDAEAVYATGMRFTFTPGAGDADGFLDGADFLFSANGTHWRDNYADAVAFVIPEPSGLLLLSLGLFTAIGRRRRDVS